MMAIRYPNNIGMVISIFCSFNSPLWLLQKSDISLKMTMDYCKFNQVVALIAVAGKRWYCCQSRLTQPWAYSLRPSIWIISFFPSLSGRRIRSSFYSHRVGSSPHLRSCPRAILTILPSIVIVWRAMDHVDSLNVTLVCFVDASC